MTDDVFQAWVRQALGLQDPGESLEHQAVWRMTVSR